MNRLQTIGLFAGIFAIAIGAISLNDTSESFFMVSAVPQSQDNFGMLGHVEYIVRDSSDSIIAYMQSDNVVTEEGRSCVALGMFDDADSVGTCGDATALFQYIAIGNFTAGDPDGTQTALDADTGNSNGCGTTGGVGNGGEQSRKLINPSFALVSGDTVITLDTVLNPFDFDVNNKTIVYQSGIFNGASSQDGDGQCTNVDSADMFAIQELNTSTGITVSAGDSLSVKWTITVGQAP